MPLVRYTCTEESCKASFSLLYKSGKEASSVVECKVCKGSAKRTLSAPSSSSKITIDNGQARSVEVHPDIMEHREDWSKPPNRGD